MFFIFVVSARVSTAYVNKDCFVYADFAIGGHVIVFDMRSLLYPEILEVLFNRVRTSCCRFLGLVISTPKYVHCMQ